MLGSPWESRVGAVLMQRWQQGEANIPKDWIVPGLALILKPGNPGTLLAHYRRIGLVDALGKASIHMLFQKIKHNLEAYVLASPQYAYVRGRSTQEALRRVFYHCHQAQALRPCGTKMAATCTIIVLVSRMCHSPEACKYAWTCLLPLM